MKRQNRAPFIRSEMLKKLLRRVILMMYLNQSIVQLHQTYKNILEKVRVGLLIQL